MPLRSLGQVSPVEHPPLYEERFVWAWDLDQGRAVRIERDDAGPWRLVCPVEGCTSPAISGVTRLVPRRRRPVDA